MEAQTPTLSSRGAQPRDLLCALTPNKGHLYFATARRVSCLGRSNRLVKSCELTIGPLFEVKAHSRSLGCALGMTKWGFALPCNVVADGWLEPPQKTNLDKTG